MARRPRSLTESDRAQWAEFARLIRPLAGRAAAPAAAPTPAAAARPAAAPVAAPPPKAKPGHAPITTGALPPGLDKASWKRFRDGSLAPVRTLDLHGKTAQAAYVTLDRFLHAAHAEHVRCVEIITGRGSGEHGGVLRRELPLWLNLPHIRPLILAVTHPGGPTPRASNTGAVRVLLRRHKPSV